MLRADGPVATGLDGADGRLALDDVAAGKSVSIQMDLNIVQLKLHNLCLGSSIIDVKQILPSSNLGY